MSGQEDLISRLREKRITAMATLSPAEREALIVDLWMSHDARWFAAVAKNYGIEVANRLNQEAIQAEGKVEARRIARALGLLPVTGLEEYLLVQEAIINIIGPDLVDYRLEKIDERTFEFKIQRCHAHENTKRAGIADQYDCAIFARTMGWLEGLEIEYEMRPSLGKCLREQGKECVYVFNLTKPGIRDSQGTLV